MTEQCPTTGFTCVNQMRARVQAVTDQVAGFVAFLQASQLTATPQMLMEHYGKAAELLQRALDGYTEDHGIIPVLDDLEAVRWVLTELKA
jgi:hypothetical protein